MQEERDHSTLSALRVLNSRHRDEKEEGYYSTAK